MVEQPQVVQQPQQNQENTNVEIDFNPPGINNFQNQSQVVNEPENYIRAVPDDQEEQNEINNEVQQLKLADVLKKIDGFRLGMQSSRMKLLNPAERKKVLTNVINTYINKDLKEKNIDKKEVQRAIDEKILLELARLGFDEDGNKITDLNESIITLRTEMPQQTTQENDKYKNNYFKEKEIDKAFRIMKEYLATTNPPNDYKEVLADLTPEERFLKLKNFYAQQATNVNNFDIIPMNDFEDAIYEQTIATLKLYGYDDDGSKIKNKKKRKRE